MGWPSRQVAGFIETYSRTGVVGGGLLDLTSRANPGSLPIEAEP